MSYASVTSTKALKWFISGLFLLKLQFCTQKLGTFCTKNPKNNKRPPFYSVPKSNKKQSRKKLKELNVHLHYLKAKSHSLTKIIVCALCKMYWNTS